MRFGFVSVLTLSCLVLARLSRQTLAAVSFMHGGVNVLIGWVPGRLLDISLPVQNQ